MVRLLSILTLLVACGDNHAQPDARSPADSRSDGRSVDVAIDGNPLTPATLFGTGLCVDPACTQISSDVHPYTPRFTLWADTASKRRWIYLPPGSQIDTTDMDHWVFPMGTKLWKEFTRGAVRIETRYIVKIGPGNTIADWYYVAYEWNATNDDAVAVPGGVANANGTSHDIPSRSQCKGCHENLAPSRVLGFGAIQLDATAASGELGLADLVGSNTLTVPPGGSSPYFPLPGNTSVEQPAIGYLHANCGHCHNPTSSIYMNNGIHMVLRLDVASLGSLATVPVYQTAVNLDATQPVDGLTKIIQPSDPSHSTMYDRFNSTNPAIHMPAAGSEMTDPTGDSTLSTWISAMPP